LQQAFDQAVPAQVHRQRQRRIAGRRGGERVDAGVEQVQRTLLQRAPGLVAGDAGGEEARQAAGAGRRGAVAQQRLQRGRGGGAEREQTERGGVAGGVASLEVGALRDQPVDAFGRRQRIAFGQQRTKFGRANQRGHALQVVQPPGVEALAQQRQRRDRK